MIYGIDTLAAARYPRKAARNACKAMGVFWNTFGKAKSVIELLCDSGASHVRIHGVWRDDHRFENPAIRTRALKIAERVASLAEKWHTTKFYYSPFCEHNLSEEKMKPILDHLNQYKCVFTPVNTPSNHGALVASHWNEVHGEDPRVPQGNYIFSYDGLDALTGNYKLHRKKHEKAKIFMVWTPALNLRAHLLDETPRKERTVRPTQKTFSDLKELFS